MPTDTLGILDTRVALPRQIVVNPGITGQGIAGVVVKLEASEEVGLVMKSSKESIAGLDSIKRLFAWWEDFAGCFGVFEIIGD